MTSNLLKPAKSLFVWIWLPGETEPLVAGRLDLVKGVHEFTYGRSYLNTPNAVPIYLPDLPLEKGIIAPAAPMTIAGCLRDGSPDFWGRRVIINRLTGRKGKGLDVDALDEMNFMLQSGSDRIGALDFQSSATTYVPRQQGEVTLEMLLDAAEYVEKGTPLPQELDEALRHGTSIGGARPKAQIQDGKTKYIAKFSASNDQHSVVKGEYIAMKIAEAAGIDVAPVELRSASGKDVILIERFDRVSTDKGETRRAMVSGLTILGLAEHEARYASYPQLAIELRRRSRTAEKDVKELFRRMCFNILVGNTDDHARNHAAFWDGKDISLTPAYDIDPRPRFAHEANQAMSVFEAENRAQLVLAMKSAHVFGVQKDEARAMIKEQVDAISDLFPKLANEVDLSAQDRDQIREKAMLREYAFEGF
ncbi:type II toxin-antitoxin system HipA family toxin [Shimia sp.]|uniref:type II toxin-antitoxin system HipA family toxin n=1 Tax=Shimia sp. TaxID=1954381 RepID=UPI003BAB3131